MKQLRIVVDLTNPSEHIDLTTIHSDLAAATDGFVQALNMYGIEAELSFYSVADAPDIYSFEDEQDADVVDTDDSAADNSVASFAAFLDSPEGIFGSTEFEPYEDEPEHSFATDEILVSFTSDEVAELLAGMPEGTTLIIEAPQEAYAG